MIQGLILISSLPILNSFPRPARVLVDRAGRDRLLVEKEDFEDIFQRDSDWMRSKSIS